VFLPQEPMPSPVNPRPSPARLAARRTGVAVSAAHGRRWAQELNFLRAHAVQSVASFTIAQPSVALTPQDLWFVYRRTPGVEVLRIGLRLRATSSATATVSVDYGTNPSSLTSATSLLLSPSPAFDGLRLVSAPTTRLRTSGDELAFLDVRGFDPANIYCVRVRITDVSVAIPVPLTLAVHEVMLATVDPVGDPTGPGLNESEFDYRNRVYAGVVGSTSGGLLRVWDELETARSASRRHLQIGAHSSAPFERDDVTEGQLDWKYENPLDTFDPVFLARSRRLRALTGTQFNTYKFAAIYSYDPTHAGLTDSYLKCRVDSTNNGGSSVASYVLQLADTGGALAIGTVTATLSWDAPDQLCEVTFKARTANDNGGAPVSDPVYVYSLALIEDET